MGSPCRTVRSKLGTSQTAKICPTQTWIAIGSCTTICTRTVSARSRLRTSRRRSTQRIRAVSDRKGSAAKSPFSLRSGASRRLTVTSSTAVALPRGSRPHSLCKGVFATACEGPRRWRTGLCPWSQALPTAMTTRSASTNTRITPSPSLRNTPTASRPPLVLLTKTKAGRTSQ